MAFSCFLRKMSNELFAKPIAISYYCLSLKPAEPFKTMMGYSFKINSIIWCENDWLAMNLWRHFVRRCPYQFQQIPKNQLQMYGRVLYQTLMENDAQNNSETYIFCIIIIIGASEFFVPCVSYQNWSFFSHSKEKVARIHIDGTTFSKMSS